jgi:hypothetical protein
MRGLAKLPKDRYVDVIAFGEALYEVLQTPFPPESPSSGFMSKMKGLFHR